MRREAKGGESYRKMRGEVEEQEVRLTLSQVSSEKLLRKENGTKVMNCMLVFLPVRFIC